MLPKLEFGVLGTLQSYVDDRPVEISAPKHRVVLARLLVDAGRIVSLEALAQAVWDAEPPADPRRAIQLYVTRLRAQLQHGGAGQLIHTHSNAYSIDVKPHQLDLGRFASLREDARRAAAEGDLEREAKALERALAQWRGAPLADVASESLHRETVPHLRELWLEALDRRIVVDQRRGKHADLISELVDVTAKHPTQERFWARLMSSLQASGRRADALDAYHTLRRVLSEQLGIDPSEELRSLHASILLDAAPSASGSSAGALVVPRQLPPGVTPFVGREAEIARLDALLLMLERDRGRHASVVVTVSGTPGVGKTALVTHWARRVADGFPDGQLWIDLHGYDRGQALPPEQVLTRFLRALGLPEGRIPAGTDGLVDLYRSIMDGRRMLLVFDNARDAEHVSPLLPGAGGCLVLVTSRRPLTGVVASTGADPIILDLMSTQDARQLLERRLGAGVAAESAAVDEVVRRCARLPLALAVVAARVATHPQFSIRSIAAELASAEGPLTALAATDPVVDIPVVFSWSYDALTVDAARLFRLLALHPGPDITPAAAASLAGTSPESAKALLRELGDAYLVTEQVPGRFGFHDLLRDYAHRLTNSQDSREERLASRDRCLDHYLVTARTAAELVHPWQLPAFSSPSTGVVAEDPRDYEQALAWFRAERHVLSAVIQQAACSGRPDRSWQIAASLVEYFYREGYWHDWVRTSSFALDQAIQHGDRLEQARAHRSLARVHARLGHAETALEHSDLGIRLLEEIDDRVELAHALSVGGIVLSSGGRQREALARFQRGFDLYGEVGGVEDEAVTIARATTLNGIGWVHALLGDYERSLACCEEALSTLIERGDPFGQAATWDSIGYAHHHLGRYEQAIGCYRTALDLARRLGARHMEADFLTHLAESYDQSADRRAADLAWKQALAVFTELGHRDAHRVRSLLRERRTKT